MIEILKLNREDARTQAWSNVQVSIRFSREANESSKSSQLYNNKKKATFTVQFKILCDSRWTQDKKKNINNNNQNIL